jgi:hypothetical protein
LFVWKKDMQFMIIAIALLITIVIIRRIRQIRRKIIQINNVIN